MKDKYLTNYYNNNNPVTDRIKIKSRLFSRILIFTICSLIYYLIKVLPSKTDLNGEVTISTALLVLEYIMILSSSIAIIGLVCIVLSLVSKQKFNEFFDKISFDTKRALFGVLDWLVILPICVVIAITLFSYFFIITPVSGSSMMPTIENGEHVLVVYNKEITRGSVVVLEVNQNDNLKTTKSDLYIKRVIGIPGDTVEWTIDKKLIINGKIVDETYFPDGYLDKLITNSFNGIFKYIDQAGQEQECVVIPEGYYFVMGDNRSQGGSKDSREIGLIKADNIIGVATRHMTLVFPGGKIE